MKSGEIVLKYLSTSACSCEGFIRHRPPGPQPRIRLALPLLKGRFGIEIGSNQEVDVESMLNGPLRRGGRGGFEGGVRGACA